VDAARGVTWLGTPAATSIRPNAALPDGVQVLGSRSYLVFHLAGIVYAEEVP
jgi:anti-sigma factor RsiW